MWFNQLIGLYFGDMAAGDRAATPSEIAAWQESRKAPELLADIAALEAQQIRETARMERERTLLEAEALALSQFGLDPDQLYVAGAAPDAPTAALTYKRLKDLDNQIKALREQL